MGDSLHADVPGVRPARQVVPTAAPSCCWFGTFSCPYRTLHLPRAVPRATGRNAGIVVVGRVAGPASQRPRGVEQSHRGLTIYLCTTCPEQARRLGPRLRQLEERHKLGKAERLQEKRNVRGPGRATEPRGDR